MDSSPGTASSNDTDSKQSPSSNGTPPSSSSSDSNNDSPSSSSSSPPPKDESPPSSPPPQSPPPSPDASPPPKNDSPPPASPPPSSSESNSSPSNDNNNNNNNNDNNNNNNNNNNNQSPNPSSNTPSQSPPPSSTVNTPSPPNGPKNAPSFLLFSPPPPVSSRESPAPPRAHLSPPSQSGSNQPSPANDDSSSTVGIVAGIAVGGIVIIAFIILCVWCSRRKKKQRYYVAPGPKGGDPYYNNNNQWNRRQSMDHVMKVPQSEMGPQSGWAGATPHQQGASPSGEFGSGYSGQAVPLPSQSPKMGLGGFSQSQFSYEELAKATDGFSQANLLGQGGFGYVHKGVLNDGRVVAIKSLKAGSGQGEREFQAEVEIISRVHHRHLVSLVGYCIANGQRMLVYEYVDNKTLEFHLHGKGQPVMDWETRLKIALGSAKGLAYLHEDCQHRIIHRDIKAANILLDLNYEALVADFGLAKLTSDNNTHVSTRVMGTFGYLAPEYASSGKLTEKSDVFSYGVMLLELITAKKPVDPSNMMEDSLVDWARPLLTRALEEEKYDGLVDARLEGNFDTDELHRMIGCAASSIRHSAKRRPKMSQIVRALEGNSSLEDLNDNPKPSKVASFAASNGAPTQSYDTGMYNADMMKFRKMIMPTQEFSSSPSE